MSQSKKRRITKNVHDDDSTTMKKMESLVGCQYYRQWMDCNEIKHEIYGTVVKCRVDTTEEDKTDASNNIFSYSYEIKYDPKIREVLNNNKVNQTLVKNAKNQQSEIIHNLHIPVCEEISMGDAWGGCREYLIQQHHSEAESLEDQRKVVAHCSPPLSHIVSWKIPDKIVRRQVQIDVTRPTITCNNDSKIDTPPTTTTTTTTKLLVPQVTMEYKEFQLTFQVKQSSLCSVHAGMGVFLSCQPLQKGEEQTEEESIGGHDKQPCFVLEPGELLDIGIYAPFRADDKKDVESFCQKNEQLIGKCEE
jgi:hypothetical protein